MPVICFEGPSAVGKTTTATAFANGEGALVVPEVNELYRRPPNPPPDWYLERQVDRWKRANSHAQSGGLAVLDGDPFQPLWYNWAYRFVGREGVDVLERFYRPLIVGGELGFPDLYIVLGASVEALHERKAGDATRRRRNFEKHLELIGPQARYFRAMQMAAPSLVRFLTSSSIDENVQVITTMIQRSHAFRENLDVFDDLISWMRCHTA